MGCRQVSSDQHTETKHLIDLTTLEALPEKVYPLYAVKEYLDACKRVYGGDGDINNSDTHQAIDSSRK